MKLFKSIKIFERFFILPVTENVFAFQINLIQIEIE